jgi:membrane protease YdiL (CAAX protease family)
MSRVAVDPSPVAAPSRADRALRAAGVASIAGAVGLLLLRPAPSMASLRSPAFLAVAYLLILAVGATVSAAEVRALPARPATAGVRASALCLAAGLGAVTVARFVVAPSPPVAASAAGVGLSVLAAVAEEALFRGGLYRLLERRGAGLAVAGSALAFALVHVPAYGWSAFPVDLGAGLLFSWQRLVTGRWSVPAATHAAANLLAVMR